MTRPIAIITLVVGLVLLAIFVAGKIWILRAEADQVSRDSLNFRFAFPASIKDLQLAEECSQARYSKLYAGTSAEPIYEISFANRLDTETLRDMLSPQLNVKQCEWRQEGRSIVYIDCPQSPFWSVVLSSTADNETECNNHSLTLQGEEL